PHTHRHPPRRHLPPPTAHPGSHHPPPAADPRPGQGSSPAGGAPPEESSPTARLPPCPVRRCACPKLKLLGQPRVSRYAFGQMPCLPGARIPLGSSASGTPPRIRSVGSQDRPLPQILEELARRAAADAGRAGGRGH